MLDAVIDFLPSPLDVPAVEGRNPRNEEEVIERHPRRKRPVRGARVQGRGAPVLRSPHLHPRLLGSPRLGRPGRQLDQGQEGAHREDLPDARQQGEPGRLGHRGQHLRRDRPQGHDHGRHAVRPPRQPGRPRVDDVPEPGHRGRDRAQDQGRPGEARHGHPEARRRRPPPSAPSSTPPRRVRPSSRAWASCTSTSSSTA